MNHSYDNSNSCFLLQSLLKLSNLVNQLDHSIPGENNKNPENFSHSKYFDIVEI